MNQGNINICINYCIWWIEQIRHLTKIIIQAIKYSFPGYTLIYSYQRILLPIILKVLCDES
ncbi:unnamed protein product [Brugia timori]|uniref:Uncharacterized protein n=1 Tax=Brugia timori TaxID=42155 RepID=A0A0R3QBS2_9BILA|nr:unnamed protein product [Brugia timori]